jgi:hypothetical protein
VTTTDPTTPPSAAEPGQQVRRQRRTALTGLGVGAACVLACSLPLLIGGGAVAAVAALLGGARPLASVVLTETVTGLAVWAVRRRRSRVPAQAGTAGGQSCGCGESGC